MAPRAEPDSGHGEGFSPFLGSPVQVPRWLPVLQGAVEPMQIDVDPQEDPQNAPDVNYVVENPTLVRSPPGGPGAGSRWLWGVSPGAGARPDSPRRPCFSLIWKPLGCSVTHLL